MQGQTSYPYGTNKIDNNAPSRSIGLTSTQGGLVILDQPFSTPPQSDETQLSSYFHIANGGNVLCQMPDGTINPFLGVVNGGFIVCKAEMIVSSAELNDSETYETTATGITWHGGQ